MGVAVVQYKYDAWGNHIVNGTKATTIGALNPFRYRSYFYDIETGLYYLQTRYYDPEVGRFLNMDSVSYADPEATNGLNLYVYCGNNPVMNVDPTGHFFWLIPVVVLAVTLPLVTVSGHKEPITASSITADDININGKNPDGFVNISISESGIEIFDSYKITNKEDQYTVLELIMQSEEYKYYGYSRSIYSYRSEWQIHNIAYYNNFMPLNAKDVFLNKEFIDFRQTLESIVYFVHMLIDH